MRLRRKLFAVAAVLGAMFLGVGLSVTPAHAGTGFQFCYETGGQACLNAWNGGPWVKVYTSRGVVNNDFTLVLNHAYNKYVLEFTGNGTSDECVGDAYNDPNNGYTSLDSCGFTGNAGWGVLFDLGSCGSNARCFKNVHWSSVQGRNDWLGPVNNYTNGSNFVLNSPNTNYFYFYNAA